MPRGKLEKLLVYELSDGSCRVALDGEEKFLTKEEYELYKKQASEIYNSKSEWAVWLLKNSLFWFCWPVKFISSSGMTIFNCDYSAKKIMGMDKNGAPAVIILTLLLMGSLCVTVTTRWKSMRRREVCGTRS